MRGITFNKLYGELKLDDYILFLNKVNELSYTSGDDFVLVVNENGEVTYKRESNLLMNNTVDKDNVTLTQFIYNGPPIKDLSGNGNVVVNNGDTVQLQYMIGLLSHNIEHLINQISNSGADIRYKTITVMIRLALNNSWHIEAGTDYDGKGEYRQTTCYAENISLDLTQYIQGIKTFVSADDFKIDYNHRLQNLNVDRRDDLMKFYRFDRCGLMTAPEVYNIYCTDPRSFTAKINIICGYPELIYNMQIPFDLTFTVGYQI